MKEAWYNIKSNFPALVRGEHTYYVVESVGNEKAYLNLEHKEYILLKDISFQGSCKEIQREIEMSPLLQACLLSEGELNEALRVVKANKSQ